MKTSYKPPYKHLLCLLTNYKDLLERYGEEELTVLCVLQELNRFKFIDHKLLKETLIGKTVSPFRKDEGAIGVLATKIIREWKDLAIQEREARRAAKEKVKNKNLLTLGQLKEEGNDLANSKATLGASDLPTNAISDAKSDCTPLNKIIKKDNSSESEDEPAASFTNSPQEDAGHKAFPISSKMLKRIEPEKNPSLCYLTNRREEESAERSDSESLPSISSIVERTDGNQHGTSLAGFSNKNVADFSESPVNSVNQTESPSSVAIAATQKRANMAPKRQHVSCFSTFINNIKNDYALPTTSTRSEKDWTAHESPLPQSPSKTARVSALKSKDHFKTLSAAHLKGDVRNETLPSSSKMLERIKPSTAFELSYNKRKSGKNYPGIGGMKSDKLSSAKSVKDKTINWDHGSNVQCSSAFSGAPTQTIVLESSDSEDEPVAQNISSLQDDVKHGAIPTSSKMLKDLVPEPNSTLPFVTNKREEESTERIDSESESLPSIGSMVEKSNWNQHGNSLAGFSNKNIPDFFKDEVNSVDPKESQSSVANEATQKRAKMASKRQYMSCYTTSIANINNDCTLSTTVIKSRKNWTAHESLFAQSPSKTSKVIASKSKDELTTLSTVHLEENAEHETLPSFSKMLKPIELRTAFKLSHNTNKSGKNPIDITGRKSDKLSSTVNVMDNKIDWDQDSSVQFSSAPSRIPPQTIFLESSKSDDEPVTPGTKDARHGAFQTSSKELKQIVPEPNSSLPCITNSPKGESAERSDCESDSLPSIGSMVEKTFRNQRGNGSASFSNKNIPEFSEDPVNSADPTESLSSAANTANEERAKMALKRQYIPCFSTSNKNINNDCALSTTAIKSRKDWTAHESLSAQSPGKTSKMPISKPKDELTTLSAGHLEEDAEHEAFPSFSKMLKRIKPNTAFKQSHNKKSCGKNSPHIKGHRSDEVSSIVSMKDNKIDWDRDSSVQYSSAPSRIPPQTIVLDSSESDDEPVTQSESLPSLGSMVKRTDWNQHGNALASFSNKNIPDFSEDQVNSADPTESLSSSANVATGERAKMAPKRQDMLRSLTSNNNINNDSALSTTAIESGKDWTANESALAQSAGKAPKISDSKSKAELASLCAAYLEENTEHKILPSFTKMLKRIESNIAFKLPHNKRISGQNSINIGDMKSDKLSSAASVRDKSTDWHQSSSVQHPCAFNEIPTPTIVLDSSDSEDELVAPVTKAFLTSSGQLKHVASDPNPGPSYILNSREEESAQRSDNESESLPSIGSMVKRNDWNQHGNALASFSNKSTPDFSEDQVNSADPAESLFDKVNTESQEMAKATPKPTKNQYISSSSNSRTIMLAHQKSLIDEIEAKVDMLINSLKEQKASTDIEIKRLDEAYLKSNIDLVENEQQTSSSTVKSHDKRHKKIVLSNVEADQKCRGSPKSTDRSRRELKLINKNKPEPLQTIYSSYQKRDPCTKVDFSSGATDQQKQGSSQVCRFFHSSSIASSRDPGCSSGDLEQRQSSASKDPASKNNLKRKSNNYNDGCRASGVNSFTNIMPPTKVMKLCLPPSQTIPLRKKRVTKSINNVDLDLLSQAVEQKSKSSAFFSMTSTSAIKVEHHSEASPSSRKRSRSPTCTIQTDDEESSFVFSDHVDAETFSSPPMKRAKNFFNQFDQ